MRSFWPLVFLAGFLLVAPMAASTPGKEGAPSDLSRIQPAINSRNPDLGPHDVASGATTTVNGPYTITGTNGVQLKYRFTTTGHVAQSWNANVSPIAPGLTLSAAGFITGSPTKAGTFLATVTAYEFPSFAGPSTSAQFAFVIAPGAAPPAITTPPANQTVAPGATATFTVSATGAPPIHYQWLFANSPIAGATNTTLQITNVAGAESGVYTVTITNSLGSVSTNATLTVESAPSIVGQPQDAIATTGSAPSLTVSATGQAIAYQWYWNSNTLAGATNATLVLSNASPAKSGYYSAVATNAAGAASSRQARVLVVDPPGPATAPSFAPVSRGPGQITLAFAVLPGYRYTLQSSESIYPSNWSPATNIPAAFAGGTIAVDLPSTNARIQFFRVLVEGN